MKSHFIKLFAFIIVAIIPVLLVLYFNQNNNFDTTAAPKRLWPIGIDSANGSIDTVYHTIPFLSAINADGKIITTDMLNGNISVIEFFFTQCPSICPIMNKQMERVYSKMAGNKNFRIFSYSIDYERDSLPALRAYAQEHHADLNYWYFLRSNPDSLFSFGQKGLKVPLSDEDQADKFLHSERFVLVDWNKNIRGYYMGTDSMEVNRLMKDIVLLMSLKEYQEKKEGKKRS